MDFPGKNTGVGCHLPPRDLPDPGIEPAAPVEAPATSCVLQVDFFFTTEPWGNLFLFDCGKSYLQHVGFLIFTGACRFF